MVLTILMPPYFILRKHNTYLYSIALLPSIFLILSYCAPVAKYLEVFAKEQDMHKEVPSAINLDSCVCVYEKLIDCKQAFDLLTFIQRVYCPSIREAGP